ncbi:MAG: acyltransferase [Bacteroidota bacterium]|nr:acyltransferase [Bacteroidota bacterium]
MKTTSTQALKYNNFDLLRILAATQVVIFHSVMYLHLAHPPGYNIFLYFAGVPMFFTMSGYLISASYERNTDLKNYVRNRIFRIYPALWFCIFLTIVTAIIFGGINFLNLQAPLWLISQMAGGIYTPGFLKHYGIGAYNSSLWTIPVELQFYIVLPILYYLINRFFIRSKASNMPFYLAWGMFFVIGLALRTKFPNILEDHEFGAAKLFRYSFIPHFYLFLAGVILQRLNASKWPIIAGKALYWVAFYILFCYFVPQTTAIIDLASTLILAMFTISLAYTLPGLSHKLLKGNDISYGVYIYHGLIINILVQKHYTGDWKYVGIVLPAAIIIALFSWKFVEEPMLRRKKKTINVQLKENEDAHNPPHTAGPEKSIAIAGHKRTT